MGFCWWAPAQPRPQAQRCACAATGFRWVKPSKAAAAPYPEQIAGLVQPVFYLLCGGPSFAGYRALRCNIPLARSTRSRDASRSGSDGRVSVNCTGLPWSSRLQNARGARLKLRAGADAPMTHHECGKKRRGSSVMLWRLVVPVLLPAWGTPLRRGKTALPIHAFLYDQMEFASQRGSFEFTCFVRRCRSSMQGT